MFVYLGLAAFILMLLSYAFLWYNKKAKILKIFTIWLIFGVAIALMPIIVNGITLTILQDNELTIQNLLANGELFIVSVAIGSDALGRILAKETILSLGEIIPLGGCFVLVILSSFLFALVSAPIEVSLDADSVSVVSSITFFMTIVTSGNCVLLSEEQT